MTIQYQVDAFTDRPFSGNPAAVCPLDAWPDKSWMADLAAENNLSETAFLVPRGDDWELRWWTPTMEVELCGHATLASGYVVLDVLAPHRDEVTFHTQSGALVVRRDGERFAVDLPADPTEPMATDPGLVAALGATPQEVRRARHDDLVVLANEAELLALEPDMRALAALDRLAFCVTAPADDPGLDFVSRYFAPACGVDEDPVTGAAHCILTPYWAARLDKPRLKAAQRSRRGGALLCEDRGERIVLSGHAVRILTAELHV